MSLDAAAPRIVLAGGGHVHTVLIQAITKARAAELTGRADVSCVMVSLSTYGYYSGMVPGLVAGQYTDDGCRVLLPALCAHYGWDFIEGRVAWVSAKNQTVTVQLADGSQQTLPYTVLSVDIGSRTAEPFDLSQADSSRVILTRPIADLNTRVVEFLHKNKALGNLAPNVVVLGAGAAGVELAFTIRARAVKEIGHEPNVTLIERRANPNYRIADAVQSAATTRHISIVRNRTATGLDPTGASVLLDDGSALPFDLLVVATGAAAWPFVKENTDLVTDDRGFIRIRSTLQATEHDNVFAVGDCASFDEYQGKFPPKAGVYAVREAPILIHNVTALLTAYEQRAVLQTYTPQTDFLALMNLGDGHAIGAKFGFTYTGWLAWLLKDRIDRAWMARFEVPK